MSYRDCFTDFGYEVINIEACDRLFISVKWFLMHSYIYEIWMKWCHGTWVRFELRELSPYGIGFSKWYVKSCASYVTMYHKHIKFQKFIVDLNQGDHEWEEVLLYPWGCYLVWNLRVARADPIGWSILAVLGNPEFCR